MAALAMTEHAADTRVVSIITPSHGPTNKYLPETLASIEQQRLPSGWAVEWLVQEDGVAPSGADKLPDAEWVHYESTGAKLSIGMTRNLALSRARGELVQVLDADDLLLPDALGTLIPAFDDQTIHWAIGQADDLLPDGSRKSFPPYDGIPFGRVPAGSVNLWAASHEGNWPIHCAGLMLRTASLRALGGWGGAPTDDDLVMFAGLAEATDGYFTETKTWLYRQHPDQTIHSAHQHRWSETCRRMALERAAAVRATGLRLSAAPAGTTESIRVGPPIKVSPRN